LVEVVDKLIKVDLQCNQAAQTVTAITPESEKDMEMNFILQALVKDIAEQLRPMVADMVREELANADGENAMAGIAANVDLAALAAEIDISALTAEIDISALTAEIEMSALATEIDISALAAEIDAADVAGEMTQSQLSDIAADVDLMELATKLDLDKLTRHVDVGQLVRDWLADQTFSVRPY
jgi:hypothetical protein